MSISDRKAREKEQRRDSILEAAGQVFGRDGYNSTTLESVADEAEISKATIYLYFKNKEDLFFTVIEEKFLDHIDSMRSVLAEAKSLEDTIQRMVNFDIRYVQEHHTYFLLMMHEHSKVSSPLHRKLRQQLIKRGVERIELLVSSLNDHFDTQRKPSIAELKSMALVIIGSVNAHVMQWMIDKKSIDLDQAKSTIAQIVMKGIT